MIELGANDRITCTKPSFAASLSESTEWNPPPPEYVACREYRHREGRDLWTGERLSGRDAREWMREWARTNQGDDFHTIERIVSAQDDVVIAERKDGLRLVLLRVTKVSGTPEKKKFTYEVENLTMSPVAA